MSGGVRLCARQWQLYGYKVWLKCKMMAICKGHEKFDDIAIRKGILMLCYGYANQLHYGVWLSP